MLKWLGQCEAEDVKFRERLECDEEMHGVNEALELIS